MKLRTSLAYTVALIALSACSIIEKVDEEAPATAIEIDGFVIRNQLPYPVTDVMLEVPATGGFAGCGNILQNSYCESEFQQVDYRANEMMISWKEWGEPFKTEPFTLKVPADIAPGSVAVVEVLIFAPGQAGAKLVRTTP